VNLSVCGTRPRRAPEVRVAPSNSILSITPRTSCRNRVGPRSFRRQSICLNIEPAQHQFTLILLRFRHHEQFSRRRPYPYRRNRAIRQFIVENDLDIGTRPHRRILQDEASKGCRTGENTRVSYRFTETDGVRFSGMPGLRRPAK